VTDAHIPHEVGGDLEGTTVSEEIETLKDKTQKISCNNGTTTINSFTSITGNAAVRGFQCEYIHQAFAIQDNRNNGIILSEDDGKNQIMLDSPSGTIKLSPGAKVLGNLEVWSGEIKLGASTYPASMSSVYTSNPGHPLGFVKMKSDIEMAEGTKVFGINHTTQEHEMVGLNEYYSNDETPVFQGEQVEIGSESVPLCLNHKVTAGWSDKNITVNYKDGNGASQVDKVAYMSDLEGIGAPTTDLSLTGTLTVDNITSSHVNQYPYPQNPLYIQGTSQYPKIIIGAEGSIGEAVTLSGYSSIDTKCIQGTIEIPALQIGQPKDRPQGSATAGKVQIDGANVEIGSEQHPKDLLVRGNITCSGTVYCNSVSCSPVFLTTINTQSWSAIMDRITALETYVSNHP
jgi:hypothetical protein